MYSCFVHRCRGRNVQRVGVETCSTLREGHIPRGGKVVVVIETPKMCRFKCTCREASNVSLRILAWFPGDNSPYSGPSAHHEVISYAEKLRERCGSFGRS
jgi:hypothetical protein